MSTLLGLAYSSDDDEGDDQGSLPPPQLPEKVLDATVANDGQVALAQERTNGTTSEFALPALEYEEAAGPMMPSVEDDEPSPPTRDYDHDTHNDPTKPPLSPFSANRAMIHNLTAPAPLARIPDSPPGSPTQSSADKVEQFRDLKAAGAHFNLQLVRNSDFRNPRMLETMAEYVDVHEQYGSNFPRNVWDVKNVPEDGSAERLAERQKLWVEGMSERQKGRRQIGFESSSNSDPKSTSERINEALARTDQEVKKETARGPQHERGRERNPGRRRDDGDRRDRDRSRLRERYRRRSRSRSADTYDKRKDDYSRRRDDRDRREYERRDERRDNGRDYRRLDRYRQ
ncbi:HCNGP-domain-containing protein [Saitoella complicata NRRL Y-17804]|uniref:HCNGP-like protein n=1 Tax=Saitoella complicata (strain BCRC 22490 / CBS 7301 / JCM 7358 / NBRC 10748 / NRRL Y-17804) TaxID=698492 RepID=A0A0E9NLE8_SAICN|nr:HCNGP-domain-containing protein [Saitoella complicata NRRL Y-17804]ODQ51758.1 HCNGP-domain-containing protein [Saitoella complicata NRRL Y-17804]GAO50623.1 hypothetical protein G7K_4747-t1 [Saitoella complicata NRRL Y-17804]